MRRSMLDVFRAQCRDPARKLREETRAHMNAKTLAKCEDLRGYGRGRIPRCEGISHQIYSLTPLATWVHARVPLCVSFPSASAQSEAVAGSIGDGVYARSIGVQGAARPHSLRRLRRHGSFDRAGVAIRMP